VVRRVAEAGLDLILDFHPDDDSIAALKAPGGEAAWLGAWSSWARRYAAIPPDKLAFELLNEPQRIYGADRHAWLAAQRSALARIRKWTSAHRVLTSGLWNPFDTLRALDPPDDPRLIATAQFYLPFEFTHMGANWDDAISAGERDLRNLRYPAALTDPRAGHVAPGGNVRRVARIAADYIDAGWDIDRLRPYVEDAARWSARHGIPVHFTEFGVLRLYADPASRNRWLRDVRSLIEAAGCGWTVWDLACLFGIAAAGKSTLDLAQSCIGDGHPSVIETGIRDALGLRAD
jgi:hypothetical protein